MRTVIAFVLLIACAAPVAALADSTTPPTTTSTASQTCKKEQASMGAALFAQTYPGKSAASSLGKCVSSHQKSAATVNANAAQSCKAQQADASFAAGHGGKTFDQFYGANGNAKGKGAGSNAFGKCVSLAVSQSDGVQAQAETAAAKLCKAARKSDATAFAGKYGAGANALGKCVAATAKTK